MSFRNTPTFVPIPEKNPSKESPAPAPIAATLKPMAGPKPPSAPWNPLIVPFVLLMGVLIFSAMRDVLTFQERYRELAENNARSSQILQEFQKQQSFLKGAHEDLLRLSTTDPVAKQILDEFFAPQKSSDTEEKKIDLP